MANIIKQAGGLLTPENSPGTSAAQLCEAASLGDVRMLTLLKDAGVELDQSDYDFRFPLHLACAKGKLLAVSYLLSICANPNAIDRWGGTPLMDALREGHLHCAKLIAANGGVLGEKCPPQLLEANENLKEVDLSEARMFIKEALAKASAATAHCDFRAAQLWISWSDAESTILFHTPSLNTVRPCSECGTQIRLQTSAAFPFCMPGKR